MQTIAKTAPSYAGRHAELYDLFYGQKPYRAEASFVDQVFRRFEEGKTSSLLELACGTGSHALAFENLGYEVTATDNSVGMLDVARAKIRSVGSRIVIQQQEMTAINLGGRLFDGIVCLFDSIGYVESNEAVIQVLRGVRKSLRENGLFVFEFWNAAAMLRNYEPLRVRRWPLADREILRISETKLNVMKQVSEVAYSIFELKHDGSYSSFQELQSNRYFLIQEMQMMLTIAGLLPRSYFAGFSFDGTVSEDTWHIVAVAQKSPEVSGEDSRLPG